MKCDLSRAFHSLSESLLDEVYSDLFVLNIGTPQGVLSFTQIIFISTL